MKLNRSVLMSLLTAGAITLLVGLYVKSLERKFYAKWGASKPVLFAKTSIPERTLVEESMVRREMVPSGFVQPGAIGSVDDVKGKMTSTNILQGEQIVAGKIATSDSELGLAVLIPEGKKAITVAINDVTGVAGLLLPNNHVDVLGTFTSGNDVVTTGLLNDIKVLAVNTMTTPRSRAVEAAEAKEGLFAGDRGRDGGGQITNATLAVTLEDAQKLALAQEIGTVTLVLRSPWDRSAGIVGRQSSTTLIGTPVSKPNKPSWRVIRGGDRGED
jgi:pilus assembly protein CpaB